MEKLCAMSSKTLLPTSCASLGSIWALCDSCHFSTLTFKYNEKQKSRAQTIKWVTSFPWASLWLRGRSVVFQQTLNSRLNTNWCPNKMNDFSSSSSVCLESSWKKRDSQCFMSLSSGLISWQWRMKKLSRSIRSRGVVAVDFSSVNVAESTEKAYQRK